MTRNRLADDVDSIELTKASSADVVLWLLARGYGISESSGTLRVAQAGAIETYVVRPGDILVRDPLTGRLLRT